MLSIYKDGIGIQSIVNKEDTKYIQVSELESEFRKIYELK